MSHPPTNIPYSISKILEHTMACAMAGLVEVLIMHPLDVVKLGLN